MQDHHRKVDEYNNNNNNNIQILKSLYQAKMMTGDSGNKHQKEVNMRKNNRIRDKT